MRKLGQKKATLILFIPNELRFFLHKALRQSEFIEYSLSNRKTSIKDVLESIGIPHIEAGSIITNGKRIGFGFHPQAGQVFRVEAVKQPLNVFVPSILRPEPLTEMKFIVDLNAGRLAKLLRMAGLDTAYEPELSDFEIAEKAYNERRIILTRDTDLLKRKNLDFGRYVRSIRPEDQLKEVVDFFDLGRFINPLTRCSICNGILGDIEKNEIIHRFEPRTILYYNEFRICGSCDRIYWAGSHIQGIMDLMKKCVE